MWLAVAAAWAAPVEVSADRWEGAGDRLHATGGVEVAFGADRLTAATAEVDAAARTITLTDGVWTRPGLGVVWFTRVELDWDGAGSAFDARYVGELGGRALTVQGDRLAWAADGTLVGEGVVLAPCDCARPPYAVEARSVTVAEGIAAYEGAKIRVFSVPVLPVPDGRLPLERASGVLPPTVGWGDDGFQAAIPLYVTLGRSADATLTPEVREDRGARGLLEGRYALAGGMGQADGAIGWDDGLRGAAAWRHTAWRGDRALAVDARYLGDAAYLQDYADGFLDRRAAWVESRALAAAGPLEAWGDAFQLDPTALAGAALRLPAADLHGAVVSLASEVAGTAEGATGVGTAAISRVAWLGPVRVTPAVVGAVSTDPWAQARFELAVPAWRPGETLEPSVRAAVGAGDSPLWEIRPALDWRRRGLDLRAEAPISPDGVRVATRGSVALASVTAWYQADLAPAPELLAGGLAWSRGRLDLSATGILADAMRYRLPEDLRSVGGAVGVTLPAALRWTAGITADPLRTWQSATAGLRWTHPARCLAVEAAGRWDADEDTPVASVRVDWLPAR